MQFSYWENQFFNDKNATVIVGSGIVGLSAAIEIKERYPDQVVIVVERFHPPQGASTKNAGFACFGSVTELLDDLCHMSENEVIEIIQMRWLGIALLKERLHKKNIAVVESGGKELFGADNFPSDEQITLCNQLMKKATGIDPYFEIGIQGEFENFNSRCIVMKNEGEINTMDMMNALTELAIEAGIRFIYGHNVSHADYHSKTLYLESGIQLNFNKLMVCTNGFTKKIYKNLDVFPARNQVCVTSEIKGLTWKGVYHYDKGYYYFRRVGDRILLGGARNFDPLTEQSDEFVFNEKIKAELTSFLKTKILPPETAVDLPFWWTGIMGMGPSKYPILDEIATDCFVAVRLGGMGVAIGSLLGKKLVDLAFKN